MNNGMNLGDWERTYKGTSGGGGHREMSQRMAGKPTFKSLDQMPSTTKN